MNKKISIIVPVYNTEKYLHRCIDSILSQSFADFELLLVNDGSNDKSGIICDEYAAKDNRIRVFHKENGGVSSARNLGIDKAKGEYIIFVDADDYIKPDYIKHFISIGDYDMMVSGFQRFGAFNDIVVPKEFKIVNIAEQLYEEWGHTAVGFLYWYPWCKMFKTDIVRKYNINFNEQMFYSEDFCFIMNYMSVIDRFALCPHYEYIHLHELNRSDKFKMNFCDFVRHISENDNCMAQIEQKCSCRFPKVQKHVHNRLFKNFLAYLKSLSQKEYKEQIVNLKSMYTNWFELLKELYLNNNWSNIKQFIMLIFTMYFPSLSYKLKITRHIHY